MAKKNQVSELERQEKRAKAAAAIAELVAEAAKRAEASKQEQKTRDARNSKTAAIIAAERLRVAQRQLEEGPKKQQRLRKDGLKNVLRRLGHPTTGDTLELRQRLIDVSQEKVPMGPEYAEAAIKAREEYDANTQEAACREAQLNAASKEMKRLNIGQLTKRQVQYLAQNWKARSAVEEEEEEAEQQQEAAVNVAELVADPAKRAEAWRRERKNTARIVQEEHPSSEPSRSRGDGGGRPAFPQEVHHSTGGGSGATLFCYGPSQFQKPYIF
jgi:hypothetical protein